ncbi:MAG: amidase [Chloroflexi bacterium]|nr:amidase [Chloroflexota bacterium]
MTFNEYSQYDGLGLAQLVREKQVTPSELLETAIERSERFNPQLNAVVLKLYDQAKADIERGLPTGPFHGVPLLIKDLGADYQGTPTSIGSRYMQNIVAKEDSETVKRLRASGVAIFGKTNLPEWGLRAVSTEPELFGACHNPWNLERSTGGSSGGSAAAVAARIVPIAQGGDGGGSIRMPSAFCGLFGLKPTRGRTALGLGKVEYWEGLNVDHALTISVRDSAAMLDVLRGPFRGAPYFPPPPERPYLDDVETEPGQLRIGFSAHPQFGQSMSAESQAALEDAIQLLRELGHEVEEVSFDIDWATLRRDFLRVIAAHVANDVDRAMQVIGRPPRTDEIENGTWALVLVGRSMSAPDYLKAVETVKGSAVQVAAMMEPYDLLLTPTVPHPPMKLGLPELTAAEEAQLSLVVALRAGGVLKMLGTVDEVADRIFDGSGLTPLFNATGQPAMSVPLYWTDDNLPMGVQFVGHYADETTLIRLAGQLERARPWADRIPPGYE